MDAAAEKFLSKISQEKLWKYLEVKACLLKCSEHEIWKVAFINIQLASESKVTGIQLPRFDNLLLIHEMFGIDALQNLIGQITIGRQIRLGTINASLEWMKNKPRYAFKMRAYVKQEYHIDEACHIFSRSGEYNDEIDNIIQGLEPLISENQAYRDLRDALRSLLDVEFGTPAFSPFVQVFAPIYVRIEEYKTDIGKIEVKISSAAEANLSKIKLLIFGEDENAKPTDLRKEIKTFTRKEDSDLLNPIVCETDSLVLACCNVPRTMQKAEVQKTIIGTPKL
jgi:hypothetical protein